MACDNWNSENNYCSVKKITIDFEDLNFCAENCEFYTHIRKFKMAICNNCDAEFAVETAEKVEVKNREHIKCPGCGSINVKRNDDTLTDGSRNSKFQKLHPL